MIKKVWKLELLVTVAALLKFFEDHPEIKSSDDLPDFPSLDDYSADNMLGIRLNLFAGDSGAMKLTFTVEYQTPVDKSCLYQTSIDLSQWAGNLAELERAWGLLMFDQLHPAMADDKNITDFGNVRIRNLEGPDYSQGIWPLIEKMQEESYDNIPSAFTVFKNGNKLSAVIFMSSVRSNGVCLTPHVYWLDNVNHDWETGPAAVEGQDGFRLDMLQKFGEIVSTGTIECEF